MSRKTILTLLLGFMAGSSLTYFLLLPRYTPIVPPTVASTIQKESIPEISQKRGQHSETTRVIRVVDGDTIEIEGGKKVRYIGIDTPETVDPRKPVQCFGREASQRNKELVLGKLVRLEKDVSETDAYGRLLRYVYVDIGGSEVMVNAYLVQEGFAHASSYPPDISHQDAFRLLEREAEKGNKGLWASCPIQAGAKDATQSVNVLSSSAGDGTCKIKGNISSASEKIYHLPGCGSYDKTAIDESMGERWFCSENEAVVAGWRKAKNC